ncbi:MAG: fused MFS/spermidine synthase [Candidatus Omnitrophica bacterium]|nr:fused MFS/spermidine synthase [Candidatus Omnitrophota bacterium]
MTLLAVTIISFGFASLFSQSIFLRELLVVFYGNELSAGVLLSSWLIGAALGSLCYSVLSRKMQTTLRTLATGLVVFSGFVWLQFLLIQYLRTFFSHFPGEIFSLGEIVFSAGVILLPSAFLTGMIFALCVELYSQLKKENSFPTVYALDSLGNMAGGIGFAFFCSALFNSLENVWGISLFLSILAIIIFLRVTKGVSQKMIYVGMMVFLALYGTVAGNFAKISSRLLKDKWRHFEVIDAQSSRYGDLVLTRNQETYSVYQNGILNFSYPAPIEVEESVHVTFSQVRDPKRVLIIGGGVGGLIAEVLKYPVEEIVYLELDSAVVDLVKKHLNPADRYALADKKVTVIHREARDFLNHYHGEKFDVILMNTPQPVSLYVNRFYTYEYFLKVREFLSEKGVFTFTLDSQEGYFSQALRKVDASVYHTLKEVFTQVELISGPKLRFIAAGEYASISSDPEMLAQRFGSLHIPADYISPEYFIGRIVTWQTDYVRGVLAAECPVKINHDFYPAAYYYGIGYFVSYFRSVFNAILELLAKLSLYHYGILVVGVLLLLAVKRKEYLPVAGVFLCGFAGMVHVIVAIMSFQIIYGYVFTQIGLISAVFMLGVSIGAFLIKRNPAGLTRSSLALVSSGFGLYCFLLAGFIGILSFWHPFFLSYCFFLSSGLAGIAVGSFFPAAQGSFLKTKRPGDTAGILYGFDMFGGACGGILISIVFVPLYGIINTCIFCGILLVTFGILSYFSLRW